MVRLVMNSLSNGGLLLSLSLRALSGPTDLFKCLLPVRFPTVPVRIDVSLGQTGNGRPRALCNNPRVGGTPGEFQGQQ